MWLARLSWTADFRQGNEKRIDLAQKVIEYLELADKDSSFREVFFNVLEDASTTCGDRVALSVIYLGIQKRLATCDLANLKDLAYLLTHGVWAIGQLEKIAQGKIATLSFVDEIEVYLGYLITLKEKLRLPLDVDNMLYFACSSLTPADLTAAKDSVLANLDSSEKRNQFLAEQPLWQKALQQNGFIKDVPALFKQGDDPYAVLRAATAQALSTPANLSQQGASSAASSRSSAVHES